MMACPPSPRRPSADSRRAASAGKAEGTGWRSFWRPNTCPSNWCKKATADFRRGCALLPGKTINLRNRGTFPSGPSRETPGDPARVARCFVMAVFGGGGSALIQNRALLLLLHQMGGTVRAPGRFDRNRGQAIGALLGFRFLLLLLPVGQAVDLADQQKQRKGHDEKVDHVIDKDAVIEGRCPRFFGCGQGTELPDRSMNRLEKSIC